MVWSFYWRTPDGCDPTSSYHAGPWLEQLNQYQRDYEINKTKQKERFDHKYRKKGSTQLSSNTEVWITSGNQQGKTSQIVGPANTPRSYIISTPEGTTRRTRQHLRVVPNSQDRESNTASSTQENTSSTRSPILTRSRTNTYEPPPA